MASEWIAFGNVWIGISRVFGQALATKFGWPGGQGPVAKSPAWSASRNNWDIRHHKNGGLSHQQVESSSGDTPQKKNHRVPERDQQLIKQFDVKTQDTYFWRLRRGKAVKDNSFQSALLRSGKHTKNVQRFLRQNTYILRARHFTDFWTMSSAKVFNCWVFCVSKT